MRLTDHSSGAKLNPSNRALPRPFAMLWASGQIVEEEGITQPPWEPTIQLMEYDNGSQALRFCYYAGSRFGRGPMILEQELLQEFSQSLNFAPRIKVMLRLMLGTTQ